MHQWNESPLLLIVVKCFNYRKNAKNPFLSRSLLTGLRHRVGIWPCDGLWKRDWNIAGYSYALHTMRMSHHCLYKPWRVMEWFSSRLVHVQRPRSVEIVSSHLLMEGIQISWFEVFISSVNSNDKPWAIYSTGRGPLGLLINKFVLRPDSFSACVMFLSV